TQQASVRSPSSAPICVGACDARISQAAPWINGPKVILSQCCSKRSRSSCSRLASSVGSGKISTGAPSGSVTVCERVAVVTRFPSWLAPRDDRVEGEPYAGEYPQPRSQEAGRALVPPIEQIVDSRVGGH